MLRYCLHSFLILLTSLPILAQEFEWARSFGGWTDDSAVGIFADTAGYLYVTGQASGSLGDHEVSGTYIAKLNQQGTPEWVQSFGNFDTNGVDVAVDGQGNVYVTGIYGYSFEFKGVRLPDGRSASIFLIKLDQLGKLVWIKSFVGVGNNWGGSFANSIALDHNNNIFLGGKFENPVQLGDSVYNVRGNEVTDSDMLLVKLSSDGDVLDVKNPGSRSEEYIYDIAVGSDGIYAVGHVGGTQIAFESNEYTLPQYGTSVIFKYSLTGQLQWFRAFNKPYHSEAITITVNDRDEVIVSGLWRETYDFSENHVFISKIDRAGNILNQQMIQGPESLHGYVRGVFGRKRWDVATSGGDTYLSAGLNLSSSIGPLNFTSSGGLDAVIIKFNEVGYPQWISTAGGPGHESARSMAIHDQWIYTAGAFSSNPLTVGSQTLDNNSGNNDQDVFIARLSDTTPNTCPPLEDFTLSYAPQLCEGESLHVSIDYPYSTYTRWFRNGEQLNMTNQSEVYIEEPGLYEVVINEDTRCPAGTLQLKVDHISDKDSATNVVIYPKPEANIHGSPAVCVQDTLSLITPFKENYSYQWIVPGFYTHSDPLSDTLNIHMNLPLAHETIYLEVKDTLTGCVSRDTFEVKVGVYEHVYISAPAQVCVGDQLLAQSTFRSGHQYLWKLPESATSVDTVANNLAVRFDEPRDSVKLILEVTEPFAGCVSEGWWLVDVEPLPDIDLQLSGNHLNVVSKDSVQLIRWYHNSVEISNMINKKSLGIKEAGNYHVVGVSASGCMASSDTVYTDLVLTAKPEKAVPLLYPNPVTDYLHIDATSTPQKVELFDLTGKVKEVFYNRSHIELENLAAGIYLVHVHYKGNSTKYKIVKK